MSGGGVVVDIELIEAVRDAVFRAQPEWSGTPNLTALDAEWIADAVLSVPALAEVIARDAKVREIVGEWATVSQIVRHSPSDQAMAKIVAAHLGAVDDSDIMPGSEFDGPVVL